MTRSAALGRAPKAVGLQLASGGPLAVEVQRPEGEVRKELVPLKPVQTANLLADRGVTERKRNQVRHEDRLKLHVSVEACAFEHVGN